MTLVEVLRLSVVVMANASQERLAEMIALLKHFVVMESITTRMVSQMMMTSSVVEQKQVVVMVLIMMVTA